MFYLIKRTCECFQEQECVELRKNRNKKEERLRVVSSNKDEQYIGHRLSESTDL